MEPSDQLAVVMVTFNSAATVRRSICAVREVFPAAEIVVVDNGSTDDTVSIVLTADPSARVLSGHGNIGFAKANNLGAGVAARSAILFLNPDAIPLRADPDDLRATLSRSPTGLLGLSLAYPGGGTAEAALLRDRKWKSQLAFSLTRAFALPAGLTVRNPRARRRRPAWVSGAACLVSKAEFVNLVGGFDERFFLYYEDWDLARRYGQCGLPVRASTAITVEHARGGSVSAVPNLARLAWGLLGLMQWTANWEGPDSAVRAARATLFLLSLIGRALSAVPPVGSVGRAARRKAAEAQLTLTELRRHAEVQRGATEAAHYPDAREALAVALETRLPISPARRRGPVR